MKRLSLILALATITFSPAMHAQTNFAAFRLHGTTSAAPDNLAAARLCLLATPQPCYTLPQIGRGETALLYSYRPTALPVTTSSNEPLILFSAGFIGGSGSSFEYALLRHEGDTLINLLPIITLTNQSNHAVWNVPSVSVMPLFVTADFLWEDGAHYGPHRSTITVYRYDAPTRHYKQILAYDTRHIFPGFDNFDHTYPVLEYERATILKKLAAKDDRK
jgi:hypothetical protein